MSQKRRRRRRPEPIVKKLRDADAMLSAGKDLAVVLLPGGCDRNCKVFLRVLLVC